MPYLIDIYILSPERSAAIVDRFLERFVPLRERCETDYSVELSGVRSVAEFELPDEMVRFCVANQNAEARAYWNNKSKDDPRSAHVFFLADGGLILGLSVAVEDQSEWDRWLSKLFIFADARHGYWTGETPPKTSVSEFIAKAQLFLRPKVSLGRNLREGPSSPFELAD